MNEAHPAPKAAGSASLLDWWATHGVATVNHHAVVEKVQEEGGWSTHYLFMTLMSAGIAVLGLLLSSPAVVIGAMLISPLMGPIIGLGFAIATFDSVEFRRSAVALALGTVLAVAFCAFVVLLSPLQTVTTEIAARTRPNLFDLLVALFSGLAGTYAMIRGRHGTIVGVAIATALMPPLAVVGYGLATANWTVFWGSTFLFFTNLMTIAAAAATLARLYGFAANLSPRQTGLQATLIVATLIALALPLGLALKQISWEALASREANEVITGRFAGEARISGISIDYDAEPIAIDATVLTPEIRPQAEREVEAMLAAILDRPVKVSIDQLRVGTEAGDAESKEIAVAKAGGVEQTTSRLVGRLALIAGVPPEQILVDSANRRAVVRAAVLPGAALATYRALEARVAASEARWNVTLVPPAAPLPDVAFEGDEPTASGRRALETAIWAARRLALPVGVSSANDGHSEALLEAFSATGVAARRIEGGGSDVSLSWLAPTQDTSAE